MKKIILLFAMMLAVAGVQAYDKNIDLSSPTTSGATWDATTNVLSFTSTNGYVIFPVSGVDTYTSVDVLVSAQSEAGKTYEIELVGNTSSYWAFGATSKDANGTAYNYSNYSIRTESENRVNDIGSITGVKIKPRQNNTDFTITVPYICFKGLDVNSNTEGFGGMTTKGSLSNLHPKVLPYSITTSGEHFFLGNYTARSNIDNYYDVTNYDAVYFKIEDYQNTTQLIAYVGTSNASDKRYAHKITDDVTDWTTTNDINAEGWYYISLSDVTALRAIATQSLGQVKNRYKVSQMYLTKSSFTMTDGKDAMDIVYDPIGASVAYDRTFTVGRKSTVCLPFALTEDEVSDAGTFYELKSVSADGKTLTFSPVTTTEAYKPYMFMAKTATPFASLTNKAIVASEGATTSYPVGDYTFHGVLAHQNVPNGAYGYNAADGVFSKATSDAVTIDAFRGYITVGGGTPAHSLDVVFDDGETTGIQTMKQAQIHNNVMFNLQGQRVSENHKGLVIVNGKKMMMK